MFEPLLASIAIEWLQAPAILASLVGLSFFIHRALKLPVAVSPLVAVSCLILVLYSAALAGMLQPAATGLFRLGFVLPLISLGIAGWGRASRARKVREALRFFHQPAIVVWVVMCLLFWFALQGATFRNWDEFSHWGLMPKALIEQHALPDRLSVVVFKSYPPAISLFHYFVYNSVSEGGLNADREDILLAAHAILLLLAIPPLLDGMRWRNAVRCGCVVCGVILSLEVFGHGFFGVLIDHLLSVLFGMILVSWFALKRHRCGPLALVPLLAVLPLCKDIGFVLAGMAAFMIVADLAVNGGWRRPAAVAAAVILLATPFAARMTWSRHIKAAELDVNMDAGRLTLPRVLAAFSTEAPDHARQVRGNFVRALLSRKIGAKAGLAVLLFCVAAYGSKSWIDRRSKLILAGGLVLGFGAYTFAHLLFYLFLFTPEEGLAIASFDRYLKIYLCAMALVALYLLTTDPAENGSTVSVGERLPAGEKSRLAFRRATAWSVWICLLAGVSLFAFAGQLNARLHFSAKYQPLENLGLRAAHQTRWDAIRRRVPPDKTVYIVWQNSDGMEFLVAGYELCPRRHNTDAWSVGTPNSAADLWTRALTLEQFRQSLSGYDYLYLGHADDRFWQAYGGLFSPSDRRSGQILFQIEKNSMKQNTADPLAFRSISLDQLSQANSASETISRY